MLTALMRRVPQASAQAQARVQARAWTMPAAAQHVCEDRMPLLRARVTVVKLQSQCEVSDCAQRQQRRPSQKYLEHERVTGADLLDCRQGSSVTTP